MTTPMISPSNYFQQRVYQLLQGMLQELMRSGHINGQMQQYVLNEFNVNANRLTTELWNKFAAYGGAPIREPSDNDIRQYLNMFINQAIANFGVAVSSQSAPMYQPGYNNAYMGNRFNAYPPMMNGLGAGQVAVFTPPPVQPMSNTASIYNTQATAPQPAPAQPAPVMTVSPRQPYTPPKDVPDSEFSGQDSIVGYRGGLKDDSDSNRQFAYVTVGLCRPVFSPDEALAYVRAHLKEELPHWEQFIVIHYPRLIPCELPWQEGKLRDALASVKEAIKHTPSNSKSKYLDNISAALGSYSCQVNDVINAILEEEVNFITQHGGLFDSEQEDLACTLGIPSLKELRRYLNPSTPESALPPALTHADTRNRLATVTREAIVRTILGLEVSDPNTPLGLDRYLAAYGDLMLNGEPFRNYPMLRERSRLTGAKGERTKEAEDCLKRSQAMFDELRKRSVLVLGNQTVVYTTFAPDSMQGDGLNTVHTADVLLGSQSSQAESSIEYLLDEALSTTGGGQAFRVCMRPRPGVHFKCAAVLTSDNWLRLKPTIW